MQYLMCIRFLTVEDVRTSSVHLRGTCHHFNSDVVDHQVTGVEVVENNEIEVVSNYCIVIFVIINMVLLEQKAVHVMLFIIMSRTRGYFGAEVP